MHRRRRADEPTLSYVADGVDYVVPRSLLGNDDGRMTFKVLTTAGVAGAFFIVDDLDVMPNVGLAAGRVQ